MLKNEFSITCKNVSIVLNTLICFVKKLGGLVTVNGLTVEAQVITEPFACLSGTVTLLHARPLSYEILVKIFLVPGLPADNWLARYTPRIEATG